jgi:hypothetical protein
LTGRAAGGRAPNRLRDFVIAHRDVEAVLQHVGLRTWDLVLVDAGGLWVRQVVRSESEGEAMCADLGIRLNRGWEDSRLARRMAGRDHWATGDGQRRAL